MIVRWLIYWIFFILADLFKLGASEHDRAANQLPEYGEQHSKPPALTSDGGHPLDNIHTIKTVGRLGPCVMDVTFFENMARMTRQAVPQRGAHGRGSGAFGYFEVTNDITKYTKAKVFEKVGKKTPIAVRLSMSAGEYGTPESTRDTRGMAVKFYTEEGIWDLLGANMPVFPFRDPSFVPHIAHTLKRNPRTNLRDSEAMWDHFTLRPESIHTLVFFLGDRSLPDGYRHMDIFAINTFIFVNSENDVVYVRFTLKTDQGIKNLPSEKALHLSAVDPDYFTRDLYNAIENGEYPSWTLYMQVMKLEEAPKYRWNPFDVTKVWLHGDYPLIPIGKIVLNRNPLNYFAEVEQMAFCPGNFVPGIGPSWDKVLLARFFAYADAQRYRLGPNYYQIPVNSPQHGLEVHNFNRDGFMPYYNQDDDPNYYPNSFGGPIPVPSAALPELNVTGTVQRYDLGDDDNYSQPRIFFNKVLKDDEKQRMVATAVGFAKTVDPKLQVRICRFFQPIDEQFAQDIARGLNIDPEVLNSK